MHIYSMSPMSGCRGQPRFRFTYNLECGGRCAVKLVVEVLNRTPNKDAFCFERIDNGLRRAGAYRLEYVMLPDLPGRGPLTLTTEITVAPGPLAQLHVQVFLICHAHAVNFANDATV